MNIDPNTFMSFMAALLLGVMWLWERRQSIARDHQLDEAHQRILRNGTAMSQLITLVQNNTKAMEALTTTGQVGLYYSANEALRLLEAKQPNSAEWTLRRYLQQAPKHVDPLLSGLHTVMERALDCLEHGNDNQALNLIRTWLDARKIG